ncbi:chromate efflux transporter [Leptospira sp. 201903070]|uniref:Chromate efflux transporter n=1 Tax=Leptospira ainlahdjerensis TaxID=2810033 RepID=A0ABS2U6V1_9LEPT|nr:chromate efflux transporter [Leptospira ainlahdjerensis]MBM9576082.1 chromate efflux transporter [Leptospira ainlahdjerensis]
MIPSLGEAFRFWFQLGWLSFGGPAGQISLMHKTLVEEKQWISEERFSHALSYCMLLPGPEAQQLATYLGWILHGVRGGILAGLFFILPSVLIFIGISILYYYYGQIPYVISFLNGVKPAILAIILLAFSNLLLKSLRSNGQKFCFLITVSGMLFFSIPYPYLLLSSLTFGIFSFYVSKKESGASLQTSALHSPPGIIDLQSRLDQRREQNSKILKQISKVGSVGLILWVLPILGILLFLKSDFRFWEELILFFTKTALLTFGGAYAILPTVADFAVDKAGWISNKEMLDGLSFGESTPGPLVMVLTFIGFLAGAYRFESVTAGLFGLSLTAYYTFLPSFIFILGGASLVEKTKESALLKFALSYVTACVCGVILYLGIYFAKSILLQEGIAGSEFQNPLYLIRWAPVVWTVCSLVFLKLKKEYSIFWIFFSGLFFLAADVLFHL